MSDINIGELQDAVKQAVIDGMAAVLQSNGSDDISPVATNRIGEGDRQIYNRKPTPFNDFDTDNFRAALTQYDAHSENVRQQIITAMQEMAAAQSRGAHKEILRQINSAFSSLSVGLDVGVQRATQQAKPADAQGGGQQP